MTYNVFGGTLNLAQLNSVAVSFALLSPAKRLLAKIKLLHQFIDWLGRVNDFYCVEWNVIAYLLR